MMINTVEALQGLYVALGGDLADVANITTIPEMLTAISTVAAAAASELPVVGKNDNGKILSVVNGKWSKANAPEAGITAVNGSIYENAQGTSSDLSFGELYFTDQDDNEIGQAELSFPAKFFLPIYDGLTKPDNSILVWDQDELKYFPATISIDNGQLVFTKITD